MSDYETLDTLFDSPDGMEGDVPVNRNPGYAANPTGSSAVPALRTSNEPKNQRKSSKRLPKFNPPDPAEVTDEWLARRFVDLYGDRLRYHPPFGGWVVFDGKRWRKSGTVTVERWVRESIKSLHECLPKIRDKSERREFEKAVLRAETLRTVKAIIGLARSDPRVDVSPQVFDGKPLLFNCLNGTIELSSGQLRPHDLADFLTKIAQVNFDPDATCPLWDEALLRSMNDNKEMVAYLRRAAGYSLTGLGTEQCLFLLYGTGRNGKTLMLEALLDVVGSDYGMMAPTHLLTSAGRTQHSTALTDLEGRRLVGISEPAGGRFDEARLKSLTGGESIRANRMHSNYTEFKATHVLFMASNHKPVADECTTGFLRRLRIIDFPVTVPEDQVDKALPAKLRGESQGILAWMVRGCLEWQTMGLNEPASVQQATKDYAGEMDPISGFIDACCARGETLRERSSSLWVAYCRWCERMELPVGERIANTTRFGTHLAQIGIGATKTMGVKFRLGIALKSLPDDDRTGPT